MLFSNLHSHHTCEGRGFYPSCYLFLHDLACMCLCVESFLVACVLWVCFGKDSGCLMLLCIAFLEVVSCGFSWVVWGKVIVGPHR